MRCYLCLGLSTHAEHCPHNPENVPLRKPPLGIKPRKLWLEDRGKELSRAIKEYLEFGTEDKTLIKEWSDELVEILMEL